MFQEPNKQNILSFSVLCGELDTILYRIINHLLFAQSLSSIVNFKLPIQRSLRS